ncbi:MAG: LysR family transcriptional regulator [Pseudomonas sp.]|uniref:LysR family transcriptional regulator n=1 Tax=Pseudomonas sp. TaxID=306 RepID=UPI00391CC9FF
MQSIWRFDPTSLKLFIAACELGSIARAADKENMVASAVSKRIAELEDAVGTALFYRHKKGITATPAGQCLLKHATRVVDDLLQMSAQLSDFAQGQRGHIRIGANRSSIIQFLPHDLRAFRTAHPAIEIELEEQTSEEAVASVLGNRHDVGIGTGLLDAAAQGLEVHDYHADELVLVVPMGHPLSRHRVIAFCDSLSFSHIALHKDSPLYRTLEQAARNGSQAINYEVHVKSFDAVCRMVQANLGIAVIPRKAVSHADGPGLVSIRLSDNWASRRFHLISRPTPYQSAACRTLLQFLRAQLPGQGHAD